MIQFDAKTRTFYLQTPKTSYIFQVYREDVLLGLYYGKRIAPQDVSFFYQNVERGFSPMMAGYDMEHPLSLDTMTLEYPTFGLSDTRAPAFHAVYPDGSRITDLRYSTHRILKGKPICKGLPQLLAQTEDAETLEVVLKDKRGLVEVTLRYTVYSDMDVISRSVSVKSTAKDPISLQKVASLNLDLPECDFDLLQLHGAWGRERNLEVTHLTHASHVIESRRGASSHQSCPFLALKRPDAGEDWGDVYGFTFIYSGNFAIQADVDQYDMTRLQVGINPFDFSWKLEPGDTFEAPEALMVFSDEGLGGMSRNFHHACRHHLGKSKYRDQKKPIILNSWEAAYFDFDEARIIGIIESAKDLGIDIFVMDDGWFGARNSDKTSLGDWTVNSAKLPGGLKPVIDACHKNGMKFGIWFEPEMVSPDSDLYRAHPDWCLHVPGVDHCTSRNQLILDLSRADVVDYLEQTVGDILAQNDIAYVKWDMNRNMTNVGSVAFEPERQGEIRHRYMLGLYDLMERLTTRFPDVLFEGCSGGGGRLDFGILYYMPQFWTSDDSDAIARLKIQYGTSMFVPASAMVGHVSACPNHQIGRTTPLKTRADVASFCNFGYELDPARFSAEEREAVKAQIERQRRMEPLVLDGDFYRLRNPFTGNDAAWMLVSPDKSEAVALFVQVLAVANAPFTRLRLRGLDPDATYQIEELGFSAGGDALMHGGIPIEARPGDFRSVTFTLRRI